jgi:nucleotide-binding universal stress UspA family protein
MAHVSRRLTNSFEGALAGGGDPATSPLYVFGPFLRLIVVAGVANITFGASVWMVVFTIAMVSAMYRLVMKWITDGSGGSGLSEEEFGPWAVKLNAGITFVEYTLTFLVSMAALVTFLADRAPVLNDSVLGFQYRTFIAVAVSLLTGWLVNRGPRVTARAFGPATAGILVLLWIMMLSTVLQHGLRLPALHLEAFSSENIGFTFGGYVRILAVMTGIEIFANLVAAYSGKPAEKSRKAFGSLLIIMGTTSLTMLVVGPAILDLTDPTDPEVSVFTQVMDQLLPGPLAVAGTVIGVAVLLSASAASALGLQNLFVGLKLRRYVPPPMGRINRFGVAPFPVWLEVSVVSFCFFLFGTDEATYLAIYAAGVFILLSMTGWAASKRLLRQFVEERRASLIGVLFGTFLASFLTSGATVIIFWERFLEGAWTYFLFLPILYGLFGYFRGQLGEPSAVEERVGASMAGGLTMSASEFLLELESERDLGRILVPMDGSKLAERALPLAVAMATKQWGSLTVITVADDRPEYLDRAKGLVEAEGLEVETMVLDGPVPEAICRAAHDRDVDMIVMSTHGHTGFRRLVMGSVTARVVNEAHRPVLVVPGGEESHVGVSGLVVTLDGSRPAERALPYATTIASQFGSRVIVLYVPEMAASDRHLDRMTTYLDGIVSGFHGAGVEAEKSIGGVDPAAEVIETVESAELDLVVMSTHGRGRLGKVLMGSVADEVVRRGRIPTLLVPVVEERFYKAAATFPSGRTTVTGTGE